MGALSWLMNLKFRGGGVAEAGPQLWVGEIETSEVPALLLVSLGHRGGAIGSTLGAEPDPLGVSLGAVGLPRL